MADERLGQGQGQQSDGLGQAEEERRRRRRLRREWDDLDFAVQRSRRYHEKFYGFYGTARDLIKVATAISGSGLFFLLLADVKLIPEVLAGFVAVWAVIDYLLAPDKKAEKHYELREQFTDLAIKIQKTPRSEEALRQLIAERLELEKTEPPCKRLVDLQARNEECRARDFPPEDLVPLGRLQRSVLGYVATFGMKRLEDWKIQRQRQTATAQQQKQAAT
jgi:hypothetical protein